MPILAGSAVVIASVEQEARLLAPKSPKVRPSLLIQPYRQSESAATFVTNAIEDPGIDQLLVVTAWLRTSGLHILAPSIGGLRAKPGRADLLVGLDYGGTTRQALDAAVRVFDRVYVVHDIEGRTFHPKLYFARGKSRGYLLIGSNNLTAGGVGFNYEAAIAQQLNLRRADDRALANEIELFATRLLSDAAICKKLTAGLLKRLDHDGWLGDEDRRTAASREDAVGSRRPPTKGSPIFTRSAVQKRTRPIPPGPSTPARRRRRPARNSLAPDSWWKKLNNTDVQRPAAGHAVGAVRITRPRGYTIDPATFFRHGLFVREHWNARTDRAGNTIEIAVVEFDCYLERRSLGVRQLRLDWGPHRAARSRATTLLHWDELADVVHQRNLKDWYLLIERGAGRLHRLTLSRRQPA